jgi:hypothetical protein
MMDRTGAPENLWFHALSYAAYIKNRVADASLGNKTPTEVAFGETPDISDILQFTFYQPVYYHAPNAPYPSTEEKLGRFLGIADSVGDDLTFWILTDDTDQVIARSVLRPADSGGDPNARLPEVNESTSPEKGEVEVNQSDGGVQLISVGETNASSRMPVLTPIRLLATSLYENTVDVLQKP